MVESRPVRLVHIVDEVGWFAGVQTGQDEPSVIGTTQPTVKSVREFAATLNKQEPG